MHARHVTDLFEPPTAAELAAFRRFAPFSALAQKYSDALCLEALVQNVPARVRLLDEGTRPTHLYLVLDGCIELYAVASGREATLGIIRPGGSFALSAVVRKLPSLVSARSCAPTRLLLLPAHDVRVAIAHDRDFARALLHELADTYRAQLRANKEIKLRNAVERLANRLIRYEREQGGKGSLVLPCDKRTLASLLSMTPENLSRAFARLGDVGVVVHGPTISLHDPIALAALARPDPLMDGRDMRTRRSRDA